MNERAQASPAFGGFLILPLKYDPARLDRARLEALGTPAPVTTADVNENVKSMFDPDSPASVGWGRVLPRQALCASLGVGCTGALKVHAGGREFDFSLEESRLYVFNTRVAFFCLALTFSNMETLAAICNPGWASSTAAWRAAPARKALFMALLEKTPMWKREWCSLRTSKAWKSWHRVRVAKAMVLAVAPPPPGRTCSPSR